MKKFIFIIVLLFGCALFGETELFYNNGQSVKLRKIDNLAATKTAAFSPRFKDELFRFNTGSEVFAIREGQGELPVYLLGNTPVIADNQLFWRGTKPIEYMTEKYGLELKEILTLSSLYLFSVKGNSAETAENIVKNGDGYAFPDIVRKAVLRFVPESWPEDAYFDTQWHLHNTGTVIDYRGIEAKIKENADVKFIQMLEFLNSEGINVDESTKIAIMDTGIVPNHKDLTNIEPGYDAISDKEGGYPDISVMENSPYADYYASSVGHGTTCAGVSAAVGNETGMSGMCPWCLLYPVRYLEGTSGTAVSESKMLKVYEKYIADPKITTINCSFGPSTEYGTIPITPAEAESHLNFMKKGRNGLGGAIVYASGNDGVDSSYTQLVTYDFVFERNGKQVSDRVITVNATTPWDTRAVYSNYGYASTVSAPSLSQLPIIGIATTAIPGYGDFQNDYTLLFSGTSAAAPVVSGLFGAIFSINPNLSLEDAIDILKKSADKIYPETGLWDKNGFSVKFGYGRINLEKAARLAAGFDMCADPKEEICGNNIDDNCDSFVDEGCAEPLTAGIECTKAADCITGSLTLADVECLKERKYWSFKGGYCVRKTNEATCPDGTKAFNMADDNENYLCALECNSIKPCSREGYYCSNDVLGICLPSCKTNSDCAKSSYCTDEGTCQKIPEPIGGTCSEDSECSGDFTTCNTWFEGGYCTQECFDSDDSICPDNSKCVIAGRRQSMSCLASCSSDEDCRVDEGYLCHPLMGSKNGVCYRKCRNVSECNDENAECSENGRCVPDNWQGWGKNDKEENKDEDGNNDSDNVDIENDSEKPDDEIPQEDKTTTIKEQGNACSISFI